MTSQSRPLPKVAVPLASLIIVAVLTLQASVTFRKELRSLPVPRFLTNRLSPPALWPFVDYPMYAHAHYEGEPIPQLRLVGILDDGSEMWIRPGDVGLDAWHFSILFVRGVDADDPARVRELVRFYQRRNNRRLVGARVENHPLVLSPHGIRSGPPEVQRSLRFQP